MSEINLSINNASLFEEICSTGNLERGFLAVKRNRGAPGIDGVTVDAFDTNLDEELRQLQEELWSWSYKPSPVRRVEIPKPDGGIRLLGVPRVRDRVVQAALKIALEPIWEPLFSEHSYGFRPNRSQRKAVEAAQKIVQSGKDFVVDLDLSKFFDRINHDRLISRMGEQIIDKRVLRLVGMILRSGIMKDGLVAPSTEGSVQGSPLSPLLSNIVLDELDKELESRGLEFCRYADDCNIFARTQKAADRIMTSISGFIERRLKLVVNKEKSQVARSSSVKFLGMTIIEGTIAISVKSINRAMTKVKELIPRGTSETLEDAIKSINQWYVGWSAYYRMTQYPAQLGKIEAHIRRRLRARIVRQQKTRRSLFNKLRKMGVKSKLAAGAVFSNRKTWALSHCRAVERAYSNKYFERIGLKTRTKELHAHWFSIGKWIRLT